MHPSIHLPPTIMTSKPTAAVELDFLGLDRDRDNTANSPVPSSSKSQLRRLYDRQRSFRDVQNAITKINPELLKASMTGSGSGFCPVSVPSSPSPGLRPAAQGAAPLTIFYNGTVSVFELPQDKAETILKFVEDGWFKKPPAAEEHKLSINTSDWVAHTTQRRMLQRNVSLQRFLEKRKERLTAMPGNGNNTKKDGSFIN